MAPGGNTLANVQPGDKTSAASRWLTAQRSAERGRVALLGSSPQLRSETQPTLRVVRAMPLPPPLVLSPNPQGVCPGLRDEER